MYHAVLAGSDLYECAEVHDTNYLALVDRADLRRVNDGGDYLNAGVSLVKVKTADEYVAVVVDVDLNVEVSAELLDNLAALADNLADLVNRYLGVDHLRSVLADCLSRLRDSLEHYFVKDIVARLVGLCERSLDDLRSKTVDLEVHLDSSDTVVCTSYLEVHVAKEVLNALDIYHSIPSVALGDKTAGDTRNRLLYRNAGVHQSQCRTAN